MFMFPYGVGMAVTSMVGNALGAKDTVLARRISSLAICLILVVDIVIALITIKYGSYYIGTLTVDQNITNITTRMLPFLALFLLIDGLQGVCNGVLRGTGRQSIGATLSIISYYCIGLPMAWFVSVHLKVGVCGLMIGMSLGSCFQAFVLLWIIFGLSNSIFVPLCADEVKEILSNV